MTRESERDTGVSRNETGADAPTTVTGGAADPAPRTRRRDFLRVVGAGAVAGGFGTQVAAGQSGEITVSGGGADIWNDADAFHYYFTDAGGDFDLVARVDSLEETDEYAKAGLMVRESLDADAKNVMVRQTPDSTSVQWRPEAGADSTSLTSDAGEDESEVDGGTVEAAWQRLVRAGDTIRAYASTDGSDWTLLTELDGLDFPAGVYVGLAVTSHSTGTLCTAEFSNATGFEPGHSQDVGDVDVAGDASGGSPGGNVDPLVATRNATEVETTAATLSGAVDSLGGASSAAVSFEYREAGASAWQSTDAETITSTGAFTASVTGLSGASDYEFRATVEAADGGSATGAVVPFSTLRPDTEPVVTTGEATSVAATSVTLNGTLSDVGGRASSAEVGFEYRQAGTDEWRSSTTETLTEPDDFGVTVFDVTTDTDYEFRAVAEADDGDATEGSVATFTTEPGVGDETAGSYFDLADGFATPAPWLDDDVQVIKITEPEYEQVQEAFQTAGPRVVVFECSGVIEPPEGESEFEITEDKCWVAGQTAPSPGITFIRGQFQVNADDCVVQHVRSRHGPGSNPGEIQSNDAVNTDNEAVNTVFDHVSASWGTDECMSIGYYGETNSMINCLVYEGLWDPYGGGADHNYATLIGDENKEVFLAGNVWSKIRNRVPRLKDRTDTVVVNNFAYFFDEAANADGDANTAFVGNGYVGMKRTDNVVLDGGNEVFVEDNYTEDPVQDEGTPFSKNNTEVDEPPLWPDGLEAMPSEELESHNLQYAGARPADRTFHDERIVQEIRDRAGNDRRDEPYEYWVGHQDEVGGFPDLAVNYHDLDVPDTGLRQWLADWALAVEEPDVEPPNGSDDGEEDLPPVGDNENAPTDPDDDGLYEDVNGNGGGDLADAVDLFQHREDEAVQDNVDAYDFSGNDGIDLADVVELFQENA